MTFGRSIASCTTLGSASASANSRKDSSTTTRSRSAIASMNCTIACLCWKPPSGLLGLQTTATRVPRARMNSAYCARSRAKPLDSWSGNMSTRLPVSMGWSVQRPKVGTGTARDSTDEEVVDPGDQLGRSVAHRHALRGQSEQVAQLGRDGVGAARVVRDDLAQPDRHLLEHGGGGEVGVAGDAEVHRAGPVALPRQRRHRRAVRRGAAEQREGVVGHGTSVGGGPAGDVPGPSCVGGPRGGARATRTYEGGCDAVQPM